MDGSSRGRGIARNQATMAAVISIIMPAVVQSPGSEPQHEPTRHEIIAVAPGENTQARGRRVYRSRCEILASNLHTGGQLVVVGRYLIREPTGLDEVRSQVLTPLVNESRLVSPGPVQPKSRDVGNAGITSKQPRADSEQGALRNRDIVLSFISSPFTL